MAAASFWRHALSYCTRSARMAASDVALGAAAGVGFCAASEPVASDRTAASVSARTWASASASWRFEHLHLDVRWVAGGMMHGVRLRLVVRHSRPEDVRHERLGISIVEGEPRALDLHHDAVSLPERVRLLVQIH